MNIKPQFFLVLLSTVLSPVLGSAEPVLPPRPPGAPHPLAPADPFVTSDRLRLAAPPLPEKPGPFLGVVTDAVNPALRAQLGLPEGVGLVVDEVLPESPAAKAGLQQHDLLKQINDQLLTAPAQLSTLVQHYGKNTEVTLTVIRKGAERKVALTIGERLMPERRTHLLKQFGDDPGRLWQKRLNALLGLPESPGSAVKILQDQHSTTWSTGSARVILKDDTGEIEVASEKGKRTLTARNPKGEIVFAGPIDTEEQRAAVPEEFRRKLDRIEVRTKTETLPQVSDKLAPRGTQSDLDRSRPSLPLQLEASPGPGGCFVQ